MKERLMLFVYCILRSSVCTAFTCPSISWYIIISQPIKSIWSLTQIKATVAWISPTHTHTHTHTHTDSPTQCGARRPTVVMCPWAGPTPPAPPACYNWPFHCGWAQGELEECLGVSLCGHACVFNLNMYVIAGRVHACHMLEVLSL